MYFSINLPIKTQYTDACQSKYFFFYHKRVTFDVNHAPSRHESRNNRSTPNFHFALIKHDKGMSGDFKGQMLSTIILKLVNF